MKIKVNVFYIVLAVALIACGSKESKNEVSENETEVEMTETSDDLLASNQGLPEGHFGKMIDEEGVINMSEFDQLIASTDDTLEVKIKSTAKEVCVKKGCWMKIDLADGNLMRVTFKDYGFFVPEDIVNKEVILAGKAFRDTTSVEDLKHYAEDGGKSEEEIGAITEPEINTTFIAEGVIIK